MEIFLSQVLQNLKALKTRFRLNKYLTKSKPILNNRGQAGLEYMLLVTFIVVALVFALNFFFPGVQRSFVGVAKLVESALESGIKFK